MALPRFRTIGVVALYSHNLSVDARWRVRLYYDAQGDNELWDSGWVQAWPSVYATSELNWEDPNFWTGVPFEDDRQDFTPLATIWPSDPQVCRLVRIEIDDQNNPDGAVRIGRPFIANLWRPDFNASYGIQYGHEIATEFEVAGNPEQTEYADVKKPRRTVSFDLSHLNTHEGFRRGLALQRQQGIHGEVLYAEETQPSAIAFARTFVGRLQSADPLTHPYYANYSQSYSLLEIL
jgi:hypothetical protein